jgi:hypothetical protein
MAGKKPRFVMTCELFRQLSASDMTVAEKRKYSRHLTDHVGSCLECNIWILDQYKAADLSRLKPKYREAIELVIAERERRIEEIKAQASSMGPVETDLEDAAAPQETETTEEPDANVA